MDGAPFGPTVTASAVQPPGVKDVSYVATLPIDKPGAWRVVVTADAGGHMMRGDAVVTVKDPGATAALGAAAPTAHTPTLADAGGIARAVTTDPAPDLRLSTRSTTDALADHTPFVLVVDSVRFRVSPACGRAVVMARYLRDRWTSVDFIHLEPYRYAVVTDTAVLDGSIGAPTLTDPAAAWGVGAEPWGPLSMPWIFVVDGNGVVRAKYQGVVGNGGCRCRRVAHRVRRMRSPSPKRFGPSQRAERPIRGADVTATIDTHGNEPGAAPAHRRARSIRPSPVVGS